MKYVVVDCVTGGSDPAQHSLLGLAMIKVTSGFQELDRLHVRIRHPTMHVSHEALARNKCNLLESGSWLDAATARTEVLKFLDAPADVTSATPSSKSLFVAVGTNIVFDLGFVREFLGSVVFGNLFMSRAEEVMDVFRFVQGTGAVAPPAGYRLHHMFDVLGITYDNDRAYSALEDAEFAVQAMRQLHKRKKLLAEALAYYCRKKQCDVDTILHGTNQTTRRKKLK